MMAGILLLGLHLLSCVLVYLGIRSGLLNIRIHMMPFVVFVPFSGLLCCLILHFRFFLKDEGKYLGGLEKMKIQEEIYRSIFTEVSETRGKVVSIEEALLVNDSVTRRNLMMDILNDRPEDYMEVLMMARMNEDVEVVHYATTAMAELSKQMDSRLQRIENRWKKHKENQELLNEYLELLKQYLEYGIAEGHLERSKRQKYAQLLKRKLSTEQTPELYKELVVNEMKLDNYGSAEAVLREMEKRWSDSQEYQLLKVEFFARTGQGEALQRQIQEIQSRQIYLSQKNREKLMFWEQKKKVQNEK